MDKDLNPVSIAEYFLELVKSQFFEFEKAAVSSKEKQISAKLLENFNDILMNVDFMVTEELIPGNLIYFYL